MHGVLTFRVSGCELKINRVLGLGLGFGLTGFCIQGLD